ncbi:spore coat protein U domain-containing protein [Acinetobacter baumannii]
MRCTESLPRYFIDGGENLQNNTRRMKNSSSPNYLSYKPYNSSSLSNEYIVGNKYLLPATTLLQTVWQILKYMVSLI